MSRRIHTSTIFILFSSLFRFHCCDAFQAIVRQRNNVAGTRLSSSSRVRYSSSSSTTSSSSSSSQSQSPLQQLVSGSIPWNQLVGQADRAFRLGIQLEKNGQARKASAAFHEAARLYQCFLDSKQTSEFHHVTFLSLDDCPAILAYTCTRLGFLSWDALGDPRAAVRLYKEAATVDPYPSRVSYEGMGQSLEASGGGRSLRLALECYRTALQMHPGNRETQFHLAVALDRLNPENDDEAQALFEQLRRDEAQYACLVDSWGYLRWHTRKIPSDDLNLHRGTRDMLEIALVAAMPLIEQGGLVAEFGVGSGRSLRLTQEILPLDVTIHGFDTFTGLPQAWGNEPAGSYSTGGIVPNLEGKVYFHKGLFRDTIRPFLAQADKEAAAAEAAATDGDGGEEEGDRVGGSAFLAYANIDCDLYSSTLDILESMHGRVIPGTILIFDEYICHSTWRQDEFRAWRECCKRFGWKYEYLAFSLITKQVVVRVTAT